MAGTAAQISAKTTVGSEKISPQVVPMNSFSVLTTGVTTVFVLDAPTTALACFEGVLLLLVMFLFFISGMRKVYSWLQNLPSFTTLCFQMDSHRPYPCTQMSEWRLLFSSRYIVRHGTLTRNQFRMYSTVYSIVNIYPYRFCT